MSDDESEQPILNIGTYTGPRNELGERHGRGGVYSRIKMSMWAIMKMVSAMGVGPIVGHT